MNRLYLTFEGQHVGESGLPVDAFAHALTGMQDAMRLMVEHLGGRQPGRVNLPAGCVSRAAYS